MRISSNQSNEKVDAQRRMLVIFLVSNAQNLMVNAGGVDACVGLMLKRLDFKITFHKASGLMHEDIVHSLRYPSSGILRAFVRQALGNPGAARELAFNSYT